MSLRSRAHERQAPPCVASVEVLCCLGRENYSSLDCSKRRPASHVPAAVSEAALAAGHCTSSGACDRIPRKGTVMITVLIVVGFCWFVSALLFVLALGFSARHRRPSASQSLAFSARAS